LLTQRCLTSFDSNLLQVLIPHDFAQGTKTKKRLSALIVLSEWWVVRDSNLRPID
jgi:hypothetical protein